MHDPQHHMSSCTTHCNVPAFAKGAYIVCSLALTYLTTPLCAWCVFVHNQHQYHKQGRLYDAELEAARWCALEEASLDGSRLLAYLPGSILVNKEPLGTGYQPDVCPNRITRSVLTAVYELLQVGCRNTQGMLRCCGASASLFTRGQPCWLLGAGWPFSRYATSSSSTCMLASLFCRGQC